MKVAFIGCGRMAIEHARTIQMLGHEISYVYGRPHSKNLEYFSKKFPEVTKCMSIQSILSVDDCQAYVVALPPAVSQELFTTFVQSGKYFLIEKPAFLNADKARSHLKSPKIAFGFNRRFYESILELRKAIKDSNTLFSFRLSERRFESFADRESLILNNSVHLLDLIHYLIPNASLKNFNLNGNIGVVKSDIYSGEVFAGDLEVLFGIPVNSEISAFQLQKHYLARPIEQLSISDKLLVTEPDSLNRVRIYAPDYQSISPIGVDLDYKPGFYLQDSKFLEMVSLGTSIDQVGDLASISDVVSTLDFAEQIIKLL
jgi:hypothetical protein